MQLIEIEDDVYGYLAKNTRRIGEPASDILRRLLGLAAKDESGDATEHELSAAMNNPRFLTQTTAVEKFLYFLGTAYTQKRSEFERVLAIQGRGRKYFARGREEIEKSGNSTQPRNIPGSPFWVLTNSPTPQKRQILRDVLGILNYSDAAVSAVSRAIG